MLHCPRQDELLARKQLFRRCGPEHLQLILDFDHTLTRFVTREGKRAPMCHDVLERSLLMPEAFRIEFANLWADQERGMAQGTWDMRKWWETSNNLFIKHGVRREWIPMMVSEVGLECRAFCGELFAELERRGVPVLVVSAGLSPVIREVLSRAGVATDRLRIVANELVFDEGGLLVSAQEPLVHSRNKDQVAVWQAEHFARISRKHVLIVGDSTHDCDPLKGLPGMEAAIRFGFWDTWSKPNALSEFEEAFDLFLSNGNIEPPDDLDLKPLLKFIQDLLDGSANEGGPEHTSQAQS